MEVSKSTSDGDTNTMFICRFLKVSSYPRATSVSLPLLSGLLFPLSSLLSLPLAPSRNVLMAASVLPVRDQRSSGQPRPRTDRLLRAVLPINLLILLPCLMKRAIHVSQAWPSG